MTASYRMKGLGWFVTCVIVALGFYLVSLQVAAERKKLDSVNHEIIRAHRDIRALQTEFSTRSNLAQLERWNGDVLALTAPTPDQYVHSEAQLASMNFDAPGQARVETAALVIPSLPDTAPPPDATPAPDAPTPPAPARVQVASATSAIDRARAAVSQAIAPARKTGAGHAKAEAVAMLDRKLLSDSTLGDLMSGARMETASLR